MSLPTYDEVREEAEALWVANQERQGLSYGSRPEAGELKEDGYWEDARRKLMRERAKDSIGTARHNTVKDNGHNENNTPKPLDDGKPHFTIGKDGFTVDANRIVTGRTAIIGASGSGKSYTVGVIAEELCKAKVPFALIDTEGEYSGLKAKYDLVRIADEPDSDLRWGAFNLKELAGQAPDAEPLILDTSESSNGGRAEIAEFLTDLYRVIDGRRTPYLVIVEEADKFIPQNGDSLPIFSEIARRGRKRGLGLMLCTQRPSLVDKDTLSQCGNQLIGRLEIRNDLQAVAQFFPDRSPNQLTGLEPGEFYVMGNISPEPQRVRIRERETPQGGAAPEITQREIKPLALTQTAEPTEATLTITLADSAKVGQYESLIGTLEGKATSPLNVSLIKSIRIKPGAEVEIKYKDKSSRIEP